MTPASYSILRKRVSITVARKLRAELPGFRGFKTSACLSIGQTPWTFPWCTKIYSHHDSCSHKQMWGLTLLRSQLIRTLISIRSHIFESGRHTPVKILFSSLRQWTLYLRLILPSLFATSSTQGHFRMRVPSHKLQVWILKRFLTGNRKQAQVE